MLPQRHNPCFSHVHPLLTRINSYDLAIGQNVTTFDPLNPLQPTALHLCTNCTPSIAAPVLSEQITVVQPKVSTDGSFLTMAFLLAICRVPKAKQVVITAGKPSGMAATAKATLASVFGRETTQPVFVLTYHVVFYACAWTFAVKTGHKSSHVPALAGM